jgi:hypothetical protein
VDAQGGGIVILPQLPQVASGEARDPWKEQGQQNEIDMSRTSYHSDDTETEQESKVKTDMGKQHNKVIKRKRRVAYMKRKQAVVKTRKKPAAGTI